MIQALVGLARRIAAPAGPAAPAGAPGLPTAVRAHGPHGPGAHGDAGDPRDRDGAGETFAALLAAARLAPPGQRPGDPLPHPPAAVAEARPAPAALGALLPALARSVAWEGDAGRGSLHLEIGAGSLAGASLLVQCDGGRVRVVLTHPAGGDLEAWRARIGARLLAAGLAVDAVE